MLPSTTVYAVLALVAALENVVPIIPADTVVALGAFMSHRGLTSPLGVFLAVWIANCAGAVAVYLATFRYGRSFMDTAIGRRLVTPAGIAVIEREFIERVERIDGFRNRNADPALTKQVREFDDLLLHG